MRPVADLGLDAMQKPKLGQSPPQPLNAGGMAVNGQDRASGELGQAKSLRTSSVLTINYDPGASLALTGGVLMGTGVLIAIFSYYAKRRRQDRPLIV